MNFIINKNYNELHGILSTFMIISNYNYFKLQLEEKWNIGFDKNIEKDIKEISENPIFHKARYFVDVEIPTNNIFINSHFITCSKDLDEYFRNLLEQNEDDLRKDIFKALEFGELIEYKDENFIDLIEKIDKEDLDSDVKWYLLSLIKEPKLYVKRFTGLIEEYLPLYQQLKDRYWKSYMEFVEWIDGKLLDHGIDFIDEHLEFINLRQYDEVQLNFTLFNLISSYHYGEGSVHLFIGLMFKKFVDDQKDKKDIDKHLTVYKVLSDKTRFDILNILIDEESYGQEIAEKLGITTATVSYHMDYLLGASLILIKRKSRRIYYSVNKEQIKNSISFLEKELRL